MSGQSDPYSRFYWRFIEEFPDIYDDKPTFGWWMTLLVGAEGAHPSPAQLPHGIPRKVIEKLVAADLLTLSSGFRYRIKGVHKERTRRSEAARVGGKARANAEQTVSGRSANGEQTVSLNETRRDETSKDKTRRALGSNDPRPISEILPELAAKFAKPS